MIFLWTSNGGPLQYIGLLAFFIQMIPFLTSQMDPAQAQNTLTACLFLGMALTLLYALYHGTWNRLSTYVTRYIRFLERTTGIRNRALISLLTCGGVFGITTLVMSSTIMDMSSLLSVLQMGVVFMVLKAQAQGSGARGQQQHRNNPQQEQESKERRFAEISKIVQNMPIEEFMSPSSLSHSDTSCSLQSLRKMLEHRGVSAHDQASFVDDNILSMPWTNIEIIVKHAVSVVKIIGKGIHYEYYPNVDMNFM
eukprot:CAMPEP_0195284022 /NCGR_PEP_ID=MMETSP0707-20130614/2383_1 /TAXON_ID=33640 /ORGANISM="Asterionellopsis glacialis, Strain CCMP134" /LENGTH=251 /DNA_ID=CAMNT_0040343315 /DNA_START=138 /DNA_END=894 /DNA_ORIENTATION=+